MLLELDDALDRLLAALTPCSAAEDVELSGAVNRVLAMDVTARDPSPPFANSAMDGYALRSADADLDSFEIVETIYAGSAPQRTLGAGECTRIFTGAPMPTGADAVIAQEDAEADGQRVRFRERPSAGRFVRRAGGDFATGEPLVAAGTRLHAGHLALIAAGGHGTVSLRPDVRVALLCTGDELTDPDAQLAPGQIHDTQRFALPAIVGTGPARVVSQQRVEDRPEALSAAFAAAAREADAIVTTGGVSVGDADHVRDVLGREGRIDFWRLAIKPGRPFAFGTAHVVPVFGLPGNPVSSIVTALLLLRPALERLAGMTPTPTPRHPARLANRARKQPGRRDFQRARLSLDEDGGLLAHPFERQDSNILTTLAQADALVDLPTACGDLDVGAPVHVIDLRGLLGAR